MPCRSLTAFVRYIGIHCVGRGYAPFLSAHFGVRDGGSCFARSPCRRWASVFGSRSCYEKNGGGFLSPSPFPVLVEPVPYLDGEAHEGDGEGDFHGDGGYIHRRLEVRKG